jgi:hypothetical protein
MRARRDDAGRAGGAAPARARERLLEAAGAGMPGFQVHGVEFLGEGLDNLSYVVNGELVVRFSKEPEPVRRAELIRAETGLLALVAKISPLPVPEPVFTDPGRGWWAYAKIPGVRLLDLLPRQRLAQAPAAGAALGGFLSALHAAPLGQMARLAGPDEVPMRGWRDEAAENYATIRTMVPATRRGPVEAFLATPPRAGAALSRCAITIWESSTSWPPRPPGRSPG